MDESPVAVNLRDPGLAALRAGPGATDAAAGLTAAARFAPLRVDAETTSSGLAPVAGAAGLVAAGLPGGGPAADTGQDRDGTGAAGGVAAPAAAGSAAENRLPIFESVESDWFRQGGQAVSRFGGDGPGRGGVGTASDEGWRAAGTVLAPASSGVTVAGLPKRTPMANLVPGTAGTGSQPESRR